MWHLEEHSLPKGVRDLLRRLMDRIRSLLKKLCWIEVGNSQCCGEFIHSELFPGAVLVRGEKAIQPCEFESIPEVLDVGNSY